jgi:hypothetical protein
MTSKYLVISALLAVALAAACDPTAAPADAYQDGPAVFAPPAVDAGRDAGSSADAGAKDAGTDAGTDAGLPVDGGARGVSIITSNNKLPRPWVVTDAKQLEHTQPLGGGTPALLRVGQLVQLNVPTTSDIPPLPSDDNCPNIFTPADGGASTCSGFTAKDSANTVVLVDTFTLIGSNTLDCAAKFNGGALPQVTGVWVGRLLASTLTSYSLALPSCTGLGVGTPYAGVTYAPATTDVHDLQLSFPSGGPVVTVRGVVTSVQFSNKPKTIFIQDPGGGELSGIAVFSSGGFPTVPSVGDYVTVVGVASPRGDFNQLVVP